MEYKAISWNMNRLNLPNKRRLIYHWLKKQKCNVICLQETHIQKKDVKYLKQRILGSEFYAATTQKKRGVVLYIKQELEPKEIFKDADGRYVALEVMMNHVKTLIVGVYAPNTSKDLFFKQLKAKLEEYHYDQMMMMGDMNGVLDLDLDRSVKRKKMDGKLPESFFQLLNQENLDDIWRQKNLKAKDYTFYLQRHETFSRIHLMLLSKNLQLITRRIEILPKVHSDHNPILWRGVAGNRARRWRMNEDLLQKQENVEFLQEESRNFFEKNWEKDVKMQTTWAAYKAVMRRLLITMNTKERKRREQVIKGLYDKLKQKKVELKKRPGKKTILKEIGILQEQIFAFERKEVEWNLKKLQQKIFEGQNKPSKLLAWQLKKRKQKKIVTRILAEGKEINVHRGIKREFYKFYAKLYSKQKIDQEQIEKYIANMQ